LEGKGEENQHQLDERKIVRRALCELKPTTKGGRNASTNGRRCDHCTPTRDTGKGKKTLQLLGWGPVMEKRKETEPHKARKAAQNCMGGRKPQGRT